MMKRSSDDLKNFDSDLPPEVSQELMEKSERTNCSSEMLLHILSASNCTGKWTMTSTCFF